mmetsp:Transcript_29712/g.96812  ORF Transcript_29712/g.96812 Transcript_29712/m.96812 type:complete len:237 (-) Transcript_29712:398-1108(-)
MSSAAREGCDGSRAYAARAAVAAAGSSSAAAASARGLRMSCAAPLQSPLRTLAPTTCVPRSRFVPNLCRPKYATYPLSSRALTASATPRPSPSSSRKRSSNRFPAKSPSVSAESTHAKLPTATPLRRSLMPSKRASARVTCGPEAVTYWYDMLRLSFVPAKPSARAGMRSSRARYASASDVSRFSFRITIRSTGPSSAAREDARDPERVSGARRGSAAKCSSITSPFVLVLTDAGK